MVYCISTYTVKDHYTLPDIKGLLNSMHGSCWITKLELLAGYHQIYITTADRYITACTTKFGLYKWRFLQGGLENAPTQFMRMLNDIMVRMKWKFIIIYLDDIMIHRFDLAECIVNV